MTTSETILPMETARKILKKRSLSDAEIIQALELLEEIAWMVWNEKE